jgi:hypothetical protein
MQRVMSCHVPACAVLLLATVLPCAMAAPVDQPPHGYHDVTVGSGDHKSVVRVADSAAPHFSNGSSSDGSANAPYNPEGMDFGKSSPLAGKSFDTGFASLSKNDTATEQNSREFSTRAFATADYSQSIPKYQTVAYNDSSRSSDGFSKNYELPPANAAITAAANQSFATKASEYQGKTALDVQMPAKTDPFATPSSLSEKTFFDPAMQHVRHDPYATGMDVKRLADLPNRPLTIDEVRDLINHEQIPDLSDKPDEPSRALNDPDWSPPTVAPSARDSIPTPPPAEMEKDGDLPAPGEMAQPPENSEPLPK